MRTRIIVAALVATLLTAFAPSSPAEAETSPVTVTTLNVHGSVDRFAGGNAGKPAAIVRDVLTLSRTQKPTVIALQEICRRQFRGLIPALVKLGYHGTMTNEHRSGGCNDRTKGNKFGDALFVKGKIEWRASYALPWGQNAAGTPGVEARRLICAKIKGQSWRVCGVHLATRNPDRANQAAAVAKIVSRWSDVIVAGDFNLTSRWVAKAFPGMASAGSGIDHIVGTSTATLVAVTPVASSDHPAVTGAVVGQPKAEVAR